MDDIRQKFAGIKLIYLFDPLFILACLYNKYTIGIATKLAVRNFLGYVRKIKGNNDTGFQNYSFPETAGNFWRRIWTPASYKYILMAKIERLRYRLVSSPGLIVKEREREVVNMYKSYGGGALEDREGD